MITLLDGFVDEPACLGVPPFISYYARYIAGAIKDAGECCTYTTIGEWRSGKRLCGDLLVILAGAMVPGRYLRDMPISLNEFLEICRQFHGIKVLTGAASKFGFIQKEGRKAIDTDVFVDFVSKVMTMHLYMI